MNRPKKLIGVLGTHTEVGKTWVAARLLETLRSQSWRVAVRKPVQSFDPTDSLTDADILARASGEQSSAVCPLQRRYALPLAPPMAADVLAQPRIELAALLREIQWPANIDVGLIETVGGPRSPLAHDGDSVDLLREAQVDEVVLVADAGLGALNAIHLALACIAPLPTRIVLNRYDAANELHRLNRRWLKEHDGLATGVDVTAMHWL